MRWSAVQDEFDKTKHARRIFRISTQFVLGIFILILGVNMMIRSQIGPAPWDTFTYHLHVLLNVTLGTSALIIQTGLISLIILLRRSYKYLYIFASIITIAIALDFWDILIFQAYYPESTLLKLGFYFGGMGVATFGLSLVVLTRFKATVIDELMLYLMDCFKTKNVFITRITVESFGLSLGLITGIIAGIGLGVINLGTLFVTLVLPFLLSLQMRWMTPVFEVKRKSKKNLDLADIL